MVRCFLPWSVVLMPLVVVGAEKACGRRKGLTRDVSPGVVITVSIRVRCVSGPCSVLVSVRLYSVCVRLVFGPCAVRVRSLFSSDSVRVWSFG